MNRKMMWRLLLLIVAFGAVPKAMAQDDVTALKKEMEKQYEALAKMQARILELEDTQKKQGTAITDMSKSGTEAKLPDTLKWLEKIKIYGDFRYRFENQDFDTRSDERDRHRIRARVGLETVINDDWTVGLRLASGSSEISTSTNQTLGDSDDDGSGFSHKDIWLDLAYADWHPIQGLQVLMGKMENPFYAVGKHQLVWDSDLTPEGIAGKYTWKFNDTLSAQLTGGGFWLKENSGGSDLSVFGGQGLLKYAMSDSSSLTGGMSYYTFGDLRNTTIDTDTFKQKGNTWSGNKYVYNYDIVEGFGEYAFKVGELPVSAYGTYLVNTASAVKEDTAWALGATINKTKDPGSWQFGYEYRNVESDAVVGGFCDSDFIDGGTGGKGHRFSLTYQLAKNVQTVFSYYLAERLHTPANAGGYDGEHMNLFQADLVIKF